jgi:hypothetical protein
MDFFKIRVSEKKGGGQEAFPDFKVGRSQDLMVRSKDFYAIWDEEAGLWSTDPYSVQRIVDAKLRDYAEKRPEISSVKYMEDFSSRSWTQWVSFLKAIGDSSHDLDVKPVFADTEVKKTDYVSRRLSYSLKPGDISAWDKVVGTLYAPEERAKIEWAIGAIVTGASRKIDKFLVLYGAPGTGKGTILSIIEQMFDGYVETFDAKSLTSSNNAYATEAFQKNPLVALQFDGDLSKIEDNTMFNMIVSSENMRVNAKYKPTYQTKITSFPILGSNKPVKITDAQSGMIRRLIDVHPSGNTIPTNQYEDLMEAIKFSYGAIAHHCMELYHSMGKHYYRDYRAIEMILQTNIFYNFIEAYHDVFSMEEGTTLDRAYDMYLEYCDKSKVSYPQKRMEFRSELKQYFETFHDRKLVNGKQVRSYYTGFKPEPFKAPINNDVTRLRLVMEETTSLLDLEYADYPAQYSNDKGTPKLRWLDVKTTLSEIDTSLEHYVNGFPENHIVADFDIRDENGEKSLELNLEAAARFPPTYAELSKSGLGVHLHYNWLGDIELLDPIFAPGIEIKVLTGNQALRRRLTLCNNVPIADLESGLPLKEKPRVLTVERMKDEQTVRRLIDKALKKDVHGGTKSNVDYIRKVLDDAFEQGMIYNVNDLEPKVVKFALNSTNQRLEALKTVKKMRWASEEELERATATPVAVKDGRLVFYDIEVYPNLFVICWKFAGDEGRESVNRMINPSAAEVEEMFNLKLVGFNNRRYDNHIMWGAYMGLNNRQLYELSQRIINGVKGVMFREAYGLSWTDIYDYSTKKQGLKKWQIELGIEHREMDLPWDEPVPEERMLDVVEYCVNDVMSTEATFNATQGDYKARLILADLSGLTANDTTAKHTAQIVFKGDKNPQREFVYTDLSKEFEGYVYEGGKSTYRGLAVGEGGFVDSEPGLYRDVPLLDVASMHPTSIGQLNLFGGYTPNFMALVDAQLAIKHGDYAAAKKMLSGKLVPYLEEIEALARTDKDAAKKAAALLRYGLKIAINIVYGLTSASFDNPFRDIRNKDNIVAKRGALFMIDLKFFIEKTLGRKVSHIKTDSVKVPGATDKEIEQIQNFAAKYGYTMELEERYAKFGLFNDAVYVAKKDECISNCWSATGAQFNPDTNPYVFKTLFGYSDDIAFQDLCVTKAVMTGGAMYLDFGAFEAYQHNGIKKAEFAANGEGINFLDEDNVWPMVGHVDKLNNGVKFMERYKPSPDEDPNVKQQSVDMAKQKVSDAATEPASIGLVHVGRVGRFTPVKMQSGGGDLWRIKDGKFYTVQGTKGYSWTTAEVAATLPADAIDRSYFDGLVEDARGQIEKFLPQSDFTSVEEFLS